MRPRIAHRLFPLIVVSLLCGRASAQNLGDVPPGGFRSPEGDTRFSAEKGAKPLNNLVFELLNVETPGTAKHAFRNPREGWIYIRLTPAGNLRNASVFLNETAVPLKLVHGHWEAMRYVAEGPHSVTLPSGSVAAQLEVRAIGELVYSTFGLNPHIKETGVYTWDYLCRHCLDHYNSIVGAETLDANGKSSHEAEIREWTSEGKRWFTHADVPYDVTTANEAYERWAQSPGMQHPLLSGIWADEFGVGEKFGKKTSQMYPIWIEAIRKLHANPKFAGRAFYAYGPSRMLPVERFEEMYPFMKTLSECGYRTAPEWYLPESQSRPGRVIVETGDLISEFSPAWEQASRESFEKASRGSASHRVVALSICSEQGWETGDIFASYNYNAFLDAEFQFLATDPSYFAIRGVQGYLSGYCAEEQTRLFAKLVRHYAIEGNTKRLLDDPYVLKHLQNADLADGATGWTLSPAMTSASDASISIQTLPGLGNLEAKYHAPEGAGDVAFRTRRHGEKPNVISQQIRGLIPGRLYSLRMLTGDLKEFTAGTSVRRKHAVSTTIENAELLDAKCFQAIVESGFWSRHGAFGPNNPYFLNYHQKVFRAKAETAELRLSDWGAPDSPGGPDGEELLWNFFQLQPYFE